LVVALLKRKTAPHFSWKRSSSDRQLSSGRNPNRDSRFRGNDTVAGARRRAKLVTPQRAIVRLPVDPRIRKGPGRCRALSNSVQPNLLEGLASVEGRDISAVRVGRAADRRGKLAARSPSQGRRTVFDGIPSTRGIRRSGEAGLGRDGRRAT